LRIGLPRHKLVQQLLIGLDRLGHLVPISRLAMATFVGGRQTGNGEYVPRTSALPVMRKLRALAFYGPCQSL
jgi:hypothetical protein